ncbi:MAG: reverse transcriptase family protein [bacterium]
MATRPNLVTQWVELWGAIARAGGIDAYITTRLTEQGFLVKRRATDGMSAAELKRYKAELKREAAERRKLKSEAWQAYRASHVVHLGDGIFFNDDLDFDAFDLPEPEARAAENELPKLDKPQQVADALGMTLAELRWLSFHREAATGLHYRRFEIRKRSGGMRAIWAPLPRLKAAQRWILREIAEHLPVHGAAHGFVPGRSILTNAQAHTGSKLILNVDLKDFFPSVTWRRVKGLFRKAGYREQVATLLALLCTEAPREIVEHEGEKLFIALGPRCLPQGAPTSPALTNALCMRLDRRLDGLARSLGWRYTRYADDLTFSLPLDHKGPPALGKLLGALHAVVAAEGFEVNPAKTRVSRPGARQKVTGLVVNGTGAPRVPRVLRRQLRAAAHNLAQGKPLPPGESVARLAGLAAFVHMADATLGAALLAELGQHR